MEPPKGASDALLSCPACLATLCVDCQRHVSRRNQFRAMFARNVRVATDVLLRPQEAHNAAAVDEGAGCVACFRRDVSAAWHAS